MDDTFSQNLKYFKKSPESKRLLMGKWGIERETHRIEEDGSIALTPHPKELTDDQITLDFAETQLEFVTKPHQNIEQVLKELEQIHHRASRTIGRELMWPLSMPPHLPDEEKIPIAQFPDSKDGYEKELYRKGLAVRYGKKLQMISGIHYNYSLDDRLIDLLYQQSKTKQSKQAFINELYMSIGRNMLKYRWLFVYLFGASPVADSSYQSVIKDKIASDRSEYTEQTSKEMELNKYAISLRTSRFGYSTEVEDKYQVSYNHLNQYIADLRTILTTENEKYKEIGLERNGERIQINTNELQIEAEFYAPIRFRQTPRQGETLLDALEHRGISYFELRDIDINPFSSIGLTKNQAEFIHMFILMCLFEENSGLSNEEQRLASKNHQLVALFGRKPNLTLYLDSGKEISLKEWGQDIFKKIIQVAEVLDQATNKSYYTKIAQAEARKLEDKSLLISEQMMHEMERHAESYLDFGLRLAHKYQLGQPEVCANV